MSVHLEGLVAQNDRSTRKDEGTKENAQDLSRVGRGRKKVSDEPLPELAEEGGIEPQQENPSEYHDRTRDRELDER